MFVTGPIQQGIIQWSSAQQSMHLTLGLCTISSSFHALAFFWLDGFAVPTPAQVTPSNKACNCLEIQEKTLS